MMAPSYGLALSTFLLTTIWPQLTHTLASAAHEASEIQSQAQSRVGAGAIPTWKLDIAFNPSALTPNASFPTSSPSETSMKMTAMNRPPIASTPGQDRGRCPMLKLTDSLSLGTRTRAQGVWRNAYQVPMASWHLNRFSDRIWQTLFIQNADQRLSIKVNKRTSDELNSLFAWQVGQPPSSYPAIDDVIKRQKAASGSVTAWKTLPVTYFSIEDCQGALLFVARLQAYSSTRPTEIEIYDSGGNLAAYAITDLSVARYQFIDTNGYLLGVAESPALNAKIPWVNVIRSLGAGKQAIPYEFLFQKGGYAGASRLLDNDYRYPMAAAVQAMAIQNSYAALVSSRSGGPGPVTFASDGIRAAGGGVAGVLFWLFLALAVLLALYGFVVLYRLVYPNEGGPVIENPWIVPAKQRIFKAPPSYL